MGEIQAFPMATGDREHGGDWVNGMTLRDYFAGQVLIGLSSIPDERKCPDYKSDATYCYKIADAMLKAREDRE